MHLEADITIDKLPQEVFDYLAHAEYLPEYMSEFAAVQQVSEGDPGMGTRYSYKMNRGTEGSFEWTRFEPTSRLDWRGPAARTGLGTMEPAGWWEISPTALGTHVKFVMAPTPGGLFKLLSPFMAAAMRKENAHALDRLKLRLEQGRSAPDSA